MDIEAPAGLLLTGGASRRMGRDKASLPLPGGLTCARRTAGLLRLVTEPVLEVGPGASGLDAIRERPAGAGPLAAVAAGRAELRRRGHRGPALVVACDLPLLTAAVLRLLADHPGSGSVVPVVDGRPQPLCARFGAEALDAAAGLLRAGKRAMGCLLDVASVTWLAEDGWSGVADATAFGDVDTPADLDRLGLRQRGAPA